MSALNKVDKQILDNLIQLTLAQKKSCFKHY